MVSLRHQSLTLQPTLSVPLLLVQESPPHRKPDSDPKLRGQADALISICTVFVSHNCKTSQFRVSPSQRLSALAPWRPAQAPERARRAAGTRAQPNSSNRPTQLGQRLPSSQSWACSSQGDSKGLTQTVNVQSNLLPRACAGITRRRLASGVLGGQAQLWERQEQHELNRSSCHTKCFMENKSRSKRKAGFLTNTFQQIWLSLRSAALPVVTNNNRPPCTRYRVSEDWIFTVKTLIYLLSLITSLMHNLSSAGMWLVLHESEDGQFLTV